MSETPKLLPCPFCGGEVIEIETPGADFVAHARPSPNCGVRFFTAGNIAATAAAWNRRAPVTEGQG